MRVAALTVAESPAALKRKAKTYVYTKKNPPNNRSPIQRVDERADQLVGRKERAPLLRGMAHPLSFRKERAIPCRGGMS